MRKLSDVSETTEELFAKLEKRSKRRERDGKKALRGVIAQISAAPDRLQRPEHDGDRHNLLCWFARCESLDALVQFANTYIPAGDREEYPEEKRHTDPDERQEMPRPRCSNRTPRGRIIITNEEFGGMWGRKRRAGVRVPSEQPSSRSFEDLPEHVRAQLQGTRAHRNLSVSLVERKHCRRRLES